MPQSKAKNRDRMRKTRLHKRLLPLLESKLVQPKPYEVTDNTPLVTGIIEYDADGSPIYEEV